MKKLITMAAVVLVLCLGLTGCGGGQMISAGSDATPYSQMPAIPPGLVEPEMPDYTRASPSGNVSVYTSGVKTLVCEYAVAPGGVVSLREALEGKKPEDFAMQYATGLADGYEIGQAEFFGTPGLTLTGTLTEDAGYGKAGNTAAYAVVAYGDYFVMVSSYGSDASVKAEAEDFLAGFAVDNAPAGVAAS